ncbi:MAG: sodium/solute symporter, partial [Planctomycetota bacterium]
LLITPVVIYVFLPFYLRLDVTTAYEYLEKRFGLNVRLLASGLFISKRLFWMALVALAPSLTLSTFTGLKVEYCILIIGVVATIYTGLGGMSAVIWTDAVQFVILMLGQVLIFIFVIMGVDGGLGEIWRMGLAEHKAWASFEFDLSQLTFWTMLIAGAVLALSDLGTDQLMVQRLMTTRDERHARQSLWFNAIFKFPAMVLLLGIGVALYCFYQVNPHLLELAPEDYDKILPYFVVTQLPTGISGIVIAAIFAAAMSSFDSGLNCLVAAFTVDWYKRLIHPQETDRAYLIRAKLMTFALGLAVAILSILIYEMGIKSIIDTSNTYLGFFGGGLVGIFLLGILTRRAKALPTVLAAILSVALVVLLDLHQSEAEGYILHPYMYGVVSCGLTMFLGYIGSLIGPELPYEKLHGYTLAKINKR